MNDENDWFGPDTATFGDRVAGARDAAGMTQTQLARRLGVKKATIVGWEDDLSEPRANKLSMMAGMLNVSIMWLLTGEGDGMDTTALAGDVDAELNELVVELRSIRGEMRASSERLARVEKALRLKLERGQ
ncbi:Transcriptional regulator, contains XRE-family HTH domain [Ruegeria halocynthiae]|uniref:Transcriptional regulator, contains XRE-family HTH domain n=1 Tax=Ruegeria halocynthiae TaxID=985054 RepID=A0A1H2UQI3_9RHOB|nr:helix-turn-helix domain-containing protein [Ruegeria halocynthiae]SDW58355.1 Transcriptional regulator, contains XRE-family HTH domain [Ruegeria halocynthiae]